MTTDIIEVAVDELRTLGIDQLSRDRGEYVRAAKALLDCATVIQRYGPLPEGYMHAGWPWGKNHKLVDSFDPQKNVLKAAALLVLEFERIDEQNETRHPVKVTA